MKYAILSLSLLAAAARLGEASPRPDLCEQAICRSPAPQRSSHLQDCQTYLRCTTTTYVPTSTKTITTTTTPSAALITKTTTLYDQITATSVVTPQSLATTVITPPNSAVTVTETPPVSVSGLTITPSPSTVTITVTPTTAITVTVTATERNKRDAPTYKNLHCATHIPAYASKPCGSSPARYSSACLHLGAHRSTITHTAHAATRTITVTKTAARITQTNVVTQPASTTIATVTRTASATTSTVTVTARASTLTSTTTLVADISVSTTVLPSATTTVATTLPAPTSTRTVPPPAPTALCDNAGLEWAVFQDEDLVPFDGDKDAWDPASHKGSGPLATGVTNYLLNSNSGQVYGTSAPSGGNMYAVEHRGYIYAPEPGRYSFGASNVDDILYVWLGAPAYSGWNKGNAVQYLRYTDFVGPTSGVYQFDFEDDDVLQYHPFRVVYKQGFGAATFGYSITSPSGLTVVGSDPSTAVDSGLVVRYSCDEVKSPKYPPFGQET